MKRSPELTARAVAAIAVAAWAQVAPAQGSATRRDPAESAAVVATVQRLFDAMAQRDTARARSVLLPGTRFVALPGDSVPARPRVQSDTAFLRSLGTRPDRLLERMWAPVVQLEGAIATVWAPYDFHRDGQWSHCGIDTVTLLRTGAGWQIASLVYTVQRQGCAPSPLGAPK